MVIGLAPSADEACCIASHRAPQTTLRCYVSGVQLCCCRFAREQELEVAVQLLENLVNQKLCERLGIVNFKCLSTRSGVLSIKDGRGAKYCV